MKVRNIMVLAAQLCGRRELADYLAGKSAADAGLAESEAELMLRCYNLTENEIALDYLPLWESEAFCSDGQILYVAFSKAPVEIQRVSDRAGNKLSFTVQADGIRVRAGEAIVTYSHRPKVKAQEDDAELNRKGDARLLALGTACEFSLMNGAFDAAAVLDKRYRDALACACRERGGRMKLRRWV